MKKFNKSKVLILCLILSTILVTNCTTKNDCLTNLSTNYPEIEEYLDSLNNGSYELENCVSNNNPNTQYGHSETNSNGIFYIDSCEFKSMTKITFDFALTTAKYKEQIKFHCFQFTDEKELIAFDKFQKSMSRAMSLSKEIHSFFKKNNKWFLYFRGFP